MKYRKFLLGIFILIVASFGLAGACSNNSNNNIPPEIRAIFDKPLYDGGIWGLRVIDLETGKVLINLKPDYPFFIGSVRKVFSVGELLNEIGAGHEFVTPVYTQGDVSESGVVDLIINPTAPGMPASVDWRSMSAALDVDNELETSAAGTDYTLELDPEFPQYIGMPGCTAAITGDLPVDFVPPLTNSFPLIQTFRIVEPLNYARTVFIEALEDAGVTVLADTVAENPVGKLPPKDSCSELDLVTTFVSLPYSDYAKLILKVSYNIGMDTSLLLYGLTQGLDNMEDALAIERDQLINIHGIHGDEFLFFDGSGGSNTFATNPAVTKWLTIMTGSSGFEAFFNGLPILAVDGSLAFVTDFQSDRTLAGATGQVHAKTGTYADGSTGELILKVQALGGYIDAKSGKRLVFEMAINEIPIESIEELLQVFQDHGTISAILWRDY